MKGRNLLSLTDCNQTELQALLDLAQKMKGGYSPQLPSKQVLGLLFYKASTRTRVSFSVAMYQLGGQVIDLNPQFMQVGRGEPIQDTARVLAGYLDVIAIRTFAQSELETFAHYAQVPIINALSDRAHPCQVLADLLTIKETFGQLKGLTLTYLGDGNNVAHSLLLGCAMAGVNIRVVTPKEYQPDTTIVEQAKALASETEIVLTTDAEAAVKGAEILYTDVWASMGQEDSATTRFPIFQPYQINEKLLKQAQSEAIVLHCLPAHRGEEITEAVLESSQSRVWQQAENRMYAQKALLAKLLGVD
ncbi:ornithine carbamoyltransferase [Euhalothece natronophila Z-M001]|uniref:Ornithine carbamoyltransferase n=1 Tax=Euhalothece natronophila Z-M001 TaxID=522448 RepID=A0A5B8NS61_9CHRO|nr:ornithine carbamoyltransferase [Euhalothece natronophila]QDZ41085.1 ornithine carbamoyltransferase [Euhalothece natronophila Z-M001]